jgi:nucleoside phosphorylase
VNASQKRHSGVKEVAYPQAREVDDRRSRAVETGRLGIARVGVLTIIDEEFEEVCSALGATAHVHDSPYYADEDGRFDVVVRQAADRSNVPAMGATLRLIEDFRPEVISVVGIAGGISGREEVALGDVVVASYLHYAEFLKRVEAGDLARYFAYDQPSVSLRESYVDPIRRGGTWRGRILEELRPEPGDPKVVVGSIVAGEKVLGNPKHEEQRAVVERFNDAVAVDMESVGVARAVHESRRAVDYNPRLVVVRGISDLVRTGELEDESAAAEENARERATWKRYAASAAAAFVRVFCDGIRASHDRRGELRGEAPE